MSVNKVPHLNRTKSKRQTEKFMKMQCNVSKSSMNDRSSICYAFNTH